MSITAPPPPPPVAEPQWKSALERANRIRLARASRMQRLKHLPTADGAVAARQLLMEPSWDVESLSVLDLLKTIHRVGRSRARRLLADARVMRENAPLRALTPRERLALAAVLGTLVR